VPVGERVGDERRPRRIRARLPAIGIPAAQPLA
jgi:hypothetical protein